MANVKATLLLDISYDPERMNPEQLAANLAAQFRTRFPSNTAATVEAVTVAEPVAIEIEGGVVHQVTTRSGRLPAPIVLIDYDIDGVDAELLTAVPRSDQTADRAYLTVIADVPGQAAVSDPVLAAFVAAQAGGA